MIEASRRVEGQRVLTHNSWMKDVFMLIYSLFACVTGNLMERLCMRVRGMSIPLK